MKLSSLSLVSLPVVASLFGFGYLTGCGGPTDDSPTNDSLAALTACHLNDGTVEPDALIRACDPLDVKKTTICHIPPGNPANAHTLCVGDPAVKHHIANHGDYLGPCRSEPRCPPPPSNQGSGGSGDGFSGTGGKTAGTGGSQVTATGGATASGGATGTGGGTGGFVIVIP